MSQTPHKIPFKNQKIIRRNFTFNSHIEHHQIYDIITEDLTKFHKYIIKELNDLKLTFKTKDGQEINEYWYVNINQKSQVYDGISQSNDDTRGDLIIEFINNNKINNTKYRSSFFFDKCNLSDVHITLHKFSQQSRKFHFSYTDRNTYRNNKLIKYQLNLKFDNNIKFMNFGKQFFKFGYNQEYDIKTISKQIIDIINDYIKIKILRKLQIERKEQNRFMEILEPSNLSKRFFLNASYNNVNHFVKKRHKPNSNNNLKIKELEDGEIQEGGFKNKLKNKTTKNNSNKIKTTKKKL